MRILSGVKNLFIPCGRRPLKIKAGPFKGIRMNLALRSQTQVYLGFFERELYPWLKQFSRGIKSAIDIGAAEGEYTLFFLLKTGAGKVHAFEPDRLLHPLLKQNLALNRITDVSRMELSERSVGASDSLTEISLDSLADFLELPCLIKMDVDGGEANILRSAARLLGLPGVRWIIETHSKRLEEDCVTILAAAGYSVKIVYEARWRILLPELRPIEHNRWLVAWNERI